MAISAHFMLFSLMATTAITLVAHPNHQATQDTDVRPVPSNQEPEGKSEVSITSTGDRRIITANGLPEHQTGRFPNRNNPNAIRAQHYQFSIPLQPVANPEPTVLVRQPFGICLNGALLDPGTAEYWKGDRNSDWHYDAKGNAFSLGLDTNNHMCSPMELTTITASRPTCLHRYPTDKLASR